MRRLTAADVILIHEEVIGDNELQGLAAHKSVEAIIGRIDNRLAYGLIQDVFELAACYACYIAVGHAFNDANKRTAFAAMDVCLVLNGIEIGFEAYEAGPKIVRGAQSIIDESELADWLRGLDRRSG